MIKLFTDRWVQFRMKVVQEARLSGKPITQVAREFGLSRPTVYSYLNHYNKGGPEALKNKPRVNSTLPLLPKLESL
jgi:transposase